MAAFHNCSNLHPEMRIFDPSHTIHQLSQQEQPKPNAHQELLSSLNRIITKRPPTVAPSNGDWTFMGLFKGPTSAAYLFLQLSELYPTATLQGKTFKEWSLAYLNPKESLKDLESYPPTPADCGVTNETLGHTCTLAVATHDSSLALKLCAYAPQILPRSPDEADEWMWGRAGYLYILRRIRVAFSNDDYVQKTVQTTIDAVVNTIINSPRPWLWRGKEFIGASHGALGIIAQLVLTTPALAPQFQDLLLKMLSYQLPSGNFPISPSKPEEDIYVQFCHGSPGVGIALISLWPYYPEIQKEIDVALERTTHDIWSRGLLSKEPCLCHGIAGNALAMVDDKEKFDYFVSCMTEKVLGEIWGTELEAQEGDEVCSLYWHEAGRAWVWAVADQGIKGGCIAFTDV